MPTMPTPIGIPIAKATSSPRLKPLDVVEGEEIVVGAADACVGVEDVAEELVVEEVVDVPISVEMMPPTPSKIMPVWL